MKKYLKNIYQCVFGALLCLLIVNLVSCDEEKGPIEAVYTVEFNSTGGSPVESQQVNRFGQAVEPQSPVKEDSIFSFWSLDAVEGEPYNFERPVFKNIVLYAYWLPGFYMVDFDTRGGSLVESQKVYPNEKVQKPEDPTKDGENFILWSLDESGGAVYDFETPVRSNFTLFAQWGKATNRVTFDTDGGSTIDPVDVGINMPVTRPADPTKEDNEFAGWYLGGQEFDFSTAIVRDITLTAKWNPLRIKDIDGNTYDVVEINGRFWIKQNLKTTKLNDGTPILIVNGPDGTVTGNHSPAAAAYDYKAENFEQFGYIYNKATVLTGKACPEGWHIPTKAEWTSLYTFVGGQNIAGVKLRAKTTWTNEKFPDEVTDEYGLSLLGGGWMEGQTFKYYGLLSGWFAAEQETDHPEGRTGYHTTAFDNRSLGWGAMAISTYIRCIKD